MVDAHEIRNTGEFSDFEVTVKDKAFKLHKFPLYTKSDYFKEAAEKNNSVKIDDFPGDEETFSTIADFCYDKPVCISAKNLALLCISAEFLKMKGDNNLINKCDKQLNSIINEAKNTRKLSPLIYTLIQAGSLPNANEIDVYKKVYQVVLGLWQRMLTKFPTGISPRSIVCVSSDDEHEEYFEDKLVTDHLVYAPLETILNIIKDCSDSNGKKKILANLMSKYLGRILDIAESESEEKNDDEKEDKNKKDDKDKKKDDKKEKDKKEDNKKDSKDKKDEDSSKDKKEKVEEAPSSPTLVKAKPVHVKSSKQGQSCLDPIERNELEAYSQKLTPDECTPISIFNKIFEQLPNDVKMHESKKDEEKCREHLLNVASKMLGRFTPEDLRDISATTLGDIVDKVPKEELKESHKQDMNSNNESSPEKNADDSEKQMKTTLSPEMINSLDQYLNDLAEKKSVSVDEYIRLLKPSVPEKIRLNHDGLVSTLLKIVDDNEPLTEEQKSEILKIVDLERCSPNSLQTILDLDLLPPKAVAEAAIKVAKSSKPSQPDYKNILNSYTPKCEPLTTHVPDLSETCPASCLSYCPDEVCSYSAPYTRCKSPGSSRLSRQDTCLYSRPAYQPCSVNFTDYYYGDKKRSYSPRSHGYISKYGYY